MRDAREQTSENGPGEAYFEDMFRNAPVGYQTLDEKGIVLDVNPAWLRLLGYERDDVVGHSFAECLDPAVADQFPERFERFKVAGEVRGAVWRMRTKSGELREISFEGRVARSASGDFLRSYCTIGDVTEVREAQRELAHERARTATYLDLIEAIVLALDARGAVTFINRAGAELLGVSAEDMIGKSWVDNFIPPEDRQWIGGLVDRLDTDGVADAESVENSVLTASGERRLIEWHNALSTEGDDLEVLSFGIDITDRRRMERELRDRDHLLNQSQALSHLGSWELDLVENVLTWSDEAYRIFGLEVGHTPVTYETFLAAVHPDDREMVNAAYTGSVEQGADGYEIVHRVVQLDSGDIRVVREECTHFRDRSGAIIRSAGMTHDITEQHAAERALRILNEELETRVEERTAELVAANSAKSEFLAAMSHELRTPLNSIIGFSSILLDGTPGEINDEQQRQLSMIQASGRRLLALVNDILDLSKIEAGAILLSPVHVDINKLCRETTEYFRQEAETAGLILDFVECDGDCLRERLALVDREKLEQILVNLLSNALKFTDEGEVRLSVQCNGMDRVRITVSDTGRGIAEEHLETVFEEFEQVGSVREAKSAGTGLGLAISRRLARAMGGEITVTSAPGEGSAFTLELPLGEESPDDE